jgi:serine phosphatase RsbU (regulator of sigma subunit)
MDRVPNSGSERLVSLGTASRPLGLQPLVAACVKDLVAFRSGTRSHDDVTVMALRWNGHKT